MLRLKQHVIYCSTVDLQVAAVTGSLQRDLGGAVQAALQSALPQQLAGPALQQALELALGSHLQAALQAPLQTAFRSSFEQRLIPAFEGACQSMFSQASRHPIVLSAACIRLVCASASKHLSGDLQLLTAQTVAASDKLLADRNVPETQAFHWSPFAATGAGHICRGPLGPSAGSWGRKCSRGSVPAGEPCGSHQPGRNAAG